MTSEEYVTRKGGLIEAGFGLSFGLKELRLNSSRILVRTRLGERYEYSKQEVRYIKLGKRKWALGRWFSIELEDGTTSDVWFGVARTPFIKALEDRGWNVVIE